MSRLARLGFAVELAREGDERDEVLARVRKEADRITTLVGEPLQLTRIEGDPTAGKWGNVALHHLLDDIVNDCDLEAEARGCRLVLRSVQPAVISGERELLHRAVENIVRNAIRNTPEGTTVEIALELRGDMAIASVRDHGPGVPEALLSDIFKPLFRVEDDRSRASGGVGLGWQSPAVPWRFTRARSRRTMSGRAWSSRSRCRTYEPQSRSRPSRPFCRLERRAPGISGG